VTPADAHAARFRAAYDGHRDAVWRYLRRRCADPGAAEDLTTEVFLVAWRRRRELPAEPLPWLYGVARRVVANHRRGAARGAALAERMRAAPAPAPGDPSDLVGLRQSLAGALALLSDRDRELVLLVAWEGLRVDEAARVLGCRRGTAAVRLHRARRRLRAALEETASPLAPMTPVEER
jgi:RNA polymerase sigma-70 factor (ECF subfamily)